MGERRNVYRVFVGKLECKRQLGRRRLRWEDDIKMVLSRIGLWGMDSSELAQVRDIWRALLNECGNEASGSIKWDFFLLTEYRLASEEGLCSLE